MARRNTLRSQLYRAARILGTSRRRRERCHRLRQAGRSAQGVPFDHSGHGWLAKAVVGVGAEADEYGGGVVEVRSNTTVSVVRFYRGVSGTPANVGNVEKGFGALEDISG